MGVIKIKGFLKYLLIVLILCVYSCSDKFLDTDFSHLDSLYGQWAWSNGIDSIWVELEKGRSIQLSDYGAKGRDTTIRFITGRYNLYNKGKLTSGNFDKETISGLVSNKKIHQLIVNDRPEPNNYFRAYLFLSNPTKNKLKWELGGIPLGGVGLWSEERPRPQPIEGFDIPDKIILTRIKD